MKKITCLEGILKIRRKKKLYIDIRQVAYNLNLKKK